MHLDQSDDYLSLTVGAPGGWQRRTPTSPPRLGLFAPDPSHPSPLQDRRSSSPTGAAQLLPRQSSSKQLGTSPRRMPSLSAWLPARKVGFPGEICVGGAGVAIGYLGLPELIRTKFVPDPFATNEDIAKGWTRMYMTGDRGRLTQDGSLILMGRRDSSTQVKLRGLRIEPDDVGSTLIEASQGLLVDAVVTVRGDPEFLVSHVVIAPNHSATADELQQLGQTLPLPQYMCPAMTIPLPSLPTTASGKVDRKALEVLPLPAAHTSRHARRPLTLSQGILKLIWLDVLRQTTTSLGLGPESDFFMVGGNSLPSRCYQRAAWGVDSNKRSI